MKTCRTCKKSQKETAFSRTVKRKDGLQVDCKKCCAIYAAEYRDKNRDQLKANDRAYVKANAIYMRAKTRA